jgi:hypothetical protein
MIPSTAVESAGGMIEGVLLDLSSIPPANPAVSKGREALRRCEAVQNGGVST